MPLKPQTHSNVELGLIGKSAIDFGIIQVETFIRNNLIGYCFSGYYYLHNSVYAILAWAIDFKHVKGKRKVAASSSRLDQAIVITPTLTPYTINRTLFQVHSLY